MSRVVFAVRRISETGQEGEARFTVEARITGASLGEVLPRLAGAARRDALVSHPEASARIAEIGVPPGRFGEIVAVPPLLAETWAESVAAGAGAELRRNGGITAEDRDTVARHPRDRGLCDDDDLRLYGLFYAFRFLDTAREALFRWCARTIRDAC